MKTESFYLIFFLSSSFLAHIIDDVIEKKLKMARQTLQFVTDHRIEIAFDTIVSSKKFRNLTEHLKQQEKPGAVIFLNKYFVNMTLNWLCNTKNYIGVHERVVAVTLDSGAQELMAHFWPQIFQFHWPLDAINVGDRVIISK